MLRRRILTIGASVMMLVAGVLIVVAALAGVGGDEKGRTIPGPRFPDVAAVRPTSIPNETATPQPLPTPEPSSAPIERFIIPRIGVNAPIQVLGVDKDGVMLDPNGPKVVAWYDFSSRPGWGSNAVFAGHVDYAGYGAAVFWDLRKLEMGDDIQVVLQDGTQYTYKVISSQAYSSEDAPVQEIVGPTNDEVVTIITCNGTFNTKTREYDKRLIVRALRAPAPSAGTKQ